MGFRGSGVQISASRPLILKDLRVGIAGSFLFRVARASQLTGFPVVIRFRPTVEVCHARRNDVLPAVFQPDQGTAVLQVARGQCVQLSGDDLPQLAEPIQKISL